MEPNAGIMNIILQTFLDRIAIGVGTVGFDAKGLLGILALMELTLMGLWWAYSGNEALGKLLRKVLTIFFFIWVIDNYTTILTWVTDGFVHTGQRAAGGGGVDINDPSGIWRQGLQVAKPILEHARDQPGIFGGLFDALISFVSALVILCAYFILALQIFLTRIEFALISTLGLILVPFGVFKHTSFIAEKVFGAVISFGVKLMVLAFVVSVGFPIMQSLSLPVDPSWPEMFSIMFGSLGLAVLGLHAPGVASGLLSGGPSLTGGALMGTGMALGGVGVASGAAAVGGLKLAVGGAKGLGSAGVGATKAAAAVTGGGSAVIGAGRVAAESGGGFSQAVGSHSKVAGAATGTVGAAGQAAYQEVANSVNSVKQQVKSGLSASYAAGHDRVTRNINERKKSSQSQEGASGGSSSESNRSAGNSGSGSAGDSGSGSSSGASETGTKNNNTSRSTGQENSSQAGNFSKKSSMKGGGRKTSGSSSSASRTGRALQVVANNSHSAQPGAGMQANIRQDDTDE